jgi:uncharacterized damage-inducible protein DinB
MDLAAELGLQLSWHWDAHVRPRLDGLGDDEYLWEPAPGFTTIAWRMGHVTEVFADRCARHFGGPPVDAPGTYPPRAADALTALDAAYAAWITAVAALDDAALATPVGDREPFPEAPLAGLVLHVHREAIHHLAEILLLRDLYRAVPPGSR